MIKTLQHYSSILFVSLCSLLSIAKTSDAAGKSDINFIENKGQITDQHKQNRGDIKFYGSYEGMNFYITPSSISYQLYQINSWNEEQVHHLFPKTIRTPKDIEIYRTDLQWLNTSNFATIQTDDAKPGVLNFYKNNVITGVRQFNGVWVRNIYPNIDLHYHANNGMLEWDFIVKPGANYHDIKLKLNGANTSLDASGNILLKTPFGTISEAAPKVYQNGKVLQAKWILNNSIISIQIEGYDAQYEMTIDPPVRLWGTYYGGTPEDAGSYAHIDNANRSFLVGYTGSIQNIATTGAHQVTYGGLDSDAFISKLDAFGNLIWATYYGGSHNDRGVACSTDANGTVYLCGITRSTNGISSPGAHQVSKGASANFLDGFLVKFDANGVRQWGTYYGGSISNEAYACPLDADGNIYLIGITKSLNAIATPGSYQPVFGGGVYDAYIAKFNSDGVRQWGTYFGGTGDDYGHSGVIGSNGDIYLVGMTSSLLFASSGVHQETYGGGTYDGFLARFDQNGNLLWNTYCGGDNLDRFNSIRLDSNGDIWVGGETQSESGIATNNAHQTVYGGGNVLLGGGDTFFAKFNTDGARLYGSYYGGSAADGGGLISIDLADNIYVIGWTQSLNNISDIDPYQANFGGGTIDGYISKFNTLGEQQWGSYFGGNGDDAILSATAYNDGDLLVCGATTSSNAIATDNAVQSSFSGSTTWDAFLVKFINCDNAAYNASSNGPVCFASELQLSASGGLNYTWTGPNNFFSNNPNPSIPSVTEDDAGDYKVVITTASGCSDSLTVTVSLLELPSITLSNNGPICEGATLQLNASGGVSYSWSGPNGFDSNDANPSISNTSASYSGIYTVVVTAANGCSDSKDINIIVNPKPVVSAVSNTPVCKGATILLSSGGGISYQWTGPNGFTSNQQDPQIPNAGPNNVGTYTVVVTDANGCTNSNTTTVNVIDCSGINYISGGVNIYPNPSNDWFVISTDAAIQSIRITSIDGRVIAFIQSPLTNNIQLSTQQLQLGAGMYLIEVKTTKETFITKLIKE